MELRERHHYPEPPSNRQAEPTVAPGSGLEALQQQAAVLFSEGSEIIKKALSGNSEAFLASNHQSGGQ